MGRSKLRGIPMEMALKLSGVDFAAGQRHGLKNPLMPKCRVLIRFFRRQVALARIFLIYVPALFSHKND
jgi:hypothetical protein